MSDIRILGFLKAKFKCIFGLAVGKGFVRVLCRLRFGFVLRFKECKVESGFRYEMRMELGLRFRLCRIRGVR